MFSCSQVKGEKFPEVPTEIRKGIKEYRKRVMKQVWPVLEKVKHQSCHLICGSVKNNIT